MKSSIIAIVLLNKIIISVSNGQYKIECFHPLLFLLHFEYLYSIVLCCVVLICFGFFFLLLYLPVSTLKDATTYLLLANASIFVWHIFQH